MWEGISNDEAVVEIQAGFFGAAAFGADTEGNILENSLGSNTKAQAALNIFMSGGRPPDFAFPPFCTL